VSDVNLGDETVRDIDATFECDISEWPATLQAWSAGEPPAEPTPYRKHHSWWRVGGFVAAIAALAVLVTGAVVSAEPSEHNAGPGYAPAAAPSTEEPPVVMPPPFTMPPDAPEVAHETSDGYFIDLLRRTGLDPDHAHGGGGISDVLTWGHDVCRERSAGYPEVALVIEGTPGLTVTEGRRAVEAAETAYCPEMK
jgi:Protein of unknown function (DUF732)